MAINKRVRSLLVISVVLVSVVIGSVIQSRDTKPARIPFPHDIAGVVVSFCSPRDWFSLQRVNHVFKESLQTGIRDMFRSQKNPVKGEFRLGEYPSSDPERYLEFVEKALDTPGMRCAVLCGELPIALINGGTILDETGKQQYLDESKKIKEVLKSEDIRFKLPNIPIGKSMAAIELTNEIDIWKLDYQNHKKTLFETHVKPKKNLFLNAAVLGNDDSLKLVFGQNLLTPFVLTLDVRSQRSRMMKLNNGMRVREVSPDGSSVYCCDECGEKITVLNNPVMDPMTSDEVFEWDKVKERFFRFEVSVPWVRDDFSARISPDSNYAVHSSFVHPRKEYLINLSNGETSLINGSVRQWISDEIIQVVVHKLVHLQSVQHPNLEISPDLSIRTESIECGLTEE